MPPTPHPGGGGADQLDVGLREPRATGPSVGADGVGRRPVGRDVGRERPGVLADGRPGVLADGRPGVLADDDETFRRESELLREPDTGLLARRPRPGDSARDTAGPAARSARQTAPGRGRPGPGAAAGPGRGTARSSVPPSRLRMQAAAARRRRPFPQRHPVLTGLTALVVVLLVVVSVSVGRALTGPGTDSASARLAEWGRDHHLGTVVTWLEQRQYAAHKPRTGGSVAGGIPRAAAPVGPNAAPQAPSGAGAVAHTAAPADVRVLAGTPIPDEGRWQTVVTVKGEPAVRVAYVRPDQVHTSYLVGVMWLDPLLLSARLHPGLQDPGGTWANPSSITPALQRSAVAAFNGGFRLYQSRGGYYADGRTVRSLRDGAASVVITRTGRLTVGAWGRDVRMTPDVVAVRQNLDLLVDHSTVNPTCTQNNTPVWGYTLGNKDFVPRSGLGVTATGAVVFVSGPSLSVCSLGQALAAAGVVRGMELDINAQWMTGAYYQHAADGTILPRKLYPTEARPADHYLTGPSTRDFFAWYARP